MCYWGRERTIIVMVCTRACASVELGMSHHYYEIMRADTSSAAIVEYYKQLSIQYYDHFEHIKD